MDLTNIISNREKIGGLEISDNGFRFCLLKKKSAKNVFSVSSGETLKQFAHKNGIGYAILTIPSRYAFTKLYRFPSIMPEDKINESIKLTASLQLPDKTDEMYWDSMNYGSDKEGKAVLVSSAEKKEVIKIISEAEKAGIKVIALETRAVSLARSIKQKTGEVLLVIEKEKDYSSFYILSENRILFLESLQNEKIKGRLSQEMKLIELNSEWTGKKINKISIICNDPLDEEYKQLKTSPLELTDGISGDKKIPESMFSVIGAAIRAKLPRKEDKLISLMDIGTEDAYKQAKANATINFLAWTTASLALFFAAAFYAVWVLIAMTQYNFNEQIVSFNASISDPYTIENKASSFNNLIGQAGYLAMNNQKWSILLMEIKSRTVEGVTIKNISLPGAKDVLSISGEAKSRDAINSFRSSLENSPLLAEISIPLDNLGKKQDIPFTATFKLKSPEVIY